MRLSLFPLSHPLYILLQWGPQGVCTGLTQVIFLSVGAPRRVYRAHTSYPSIGGGPKACVQGSRGLFFYRWGPQGVCTGPPHLFLLFGSTALSLTTPHQPLPPHNATDLSGGNVSAFHLQ
jgi:hypothetical protein